MTTKEKIEVMQAFEDGNPIECIPRKGCKWVSINDCIPPEPIWDWESCAYRIKPETAPASQLDRIKAEYAEYRVEVCKMREESGDLIIDIAGRPLHITAQSMKGFYRYVYKGSVEGTFYISRFPTDEVAYPANGPIIHPVAVLFTK